MNIIRCTTPQYVGILAACMEHPDYDAAEFQSIVANWLVNIPDATYLIAAIDGDKILAVMCSTIDAMSSKYAFVHFSWAAPSTATTEVPQRMFAMTARWAESMGKPRLRMETRRDPAAFQRKWAFKPVATIMEFTVSDWFEDFKAKNQAPDAAEMTDGRQQQQPLSSVDVDQAPAAGLEVGGGGHPGESEPGRDAV